MLLACGLGLYNVGWLVGWGCVMLLVRCLTRASGGRTGQWQEKWLGLPNVAGLVSLDMGLPNVARSCLGLGCLMFGVA